MHIVKVAMFYLMKMAHNVNRDNMGPRISNSLNESMCGHRDVTDCLLREKFVNVMRHPAGIRHHYFRAFQ